MRPTDDEIRRAAYERWERRGWWHGGDRDDWYAAEKDLTFHTHYRTIVEYALDGGLRRMLGEVATRRCRFCERTARADHFGAPRPVVADRNALLSAEICGDCRADWCDSLDEDFRAFWDRLRGEAFLFTGGRPVFSVAAFKAMTVGALMILPASELRYFFDALEWVSNPDHDADDRLLDLAECRVYRASFLGERPRVTLARRRDDDEPVPYMLFSIEADGLLVQVPLPMCLRDEDLDGREIERPERIPVSGYGHEFREARGVILPLSVSRRRGGRGSRLPAIA